MKNVIKIALVTNTISKPGGAEYVTISMFNSLRSLNVEVKILGRERIVDLNTLTKWISSDLALSIINNYEYIPKFPFNLFELRKYDLVINTRSNEVLAPAHIHYLHWIFSPFHIKNAEVLAYYRHAYGITNQRVRWATRHILHYIQSKATKLVLANSIYVANLLKEIGINAKVLHPPVRSKEILRITSKSNWRDRDKLVMTVTRIAPGKQLELIPIIASKVKEVKFVLVGSLTDEKYYAKLLKLKKLVKADNFTVMLNISSDELYKLLGKAMIYLHTARHEQFGIAIVEGMAAGCIPVVHRSGGPYIDILDEKEGVYGFSYRELEEAITIIKDILYNKDRYRNLSERARRRSLLFDEDMFKLKFRKFIKQYA